MSEPDGLFLNLATDTGSGGQKKQKITGGRWKDRQRARNVERNRQRKVAGPKIERSKVAKTEGSTQRPSRKKQSSSGKSEKSENGKYMVKKILDADKTKGGQETFVSSLFSKNSEHVPHEATEGYVAHEASNAPLQDSTEFEGLGLNHPLCTLLKDKMELERPTRIQRAVLPRIMSREDDLFIQAETGSGKTLAYALPIIVRLMQEPYLDRNSGLFAVIIAPTRELSTQIFTVLEQLVRCCHWLVPGIVIGGEKKKSEKQRIRKGINVLVGTPGRLADHFDNTSSLDLSQVRWVVMDEGDMLMELGFEQTINHIMDTISSQAAFKSMKLPSRRVNVLCSATMKGNVQRLSQKSLSKDADIVTPDTVEGDTNGEVSTKPTVAPAQLVQNCVVVPAKLRLVTLASLLMDFVKNNKASRVIVFFSCADSVEFHFDAFTRDGESPNAADSSVQARTAPLLGANNATIYKVHGSLDQPVRRATVAAFKNAPHDAPAILFSTDLLSRGVDLPMVSNVIEYDPPAEPEEHLHRVGRTARAGAAGSSVLFLLPGKEEAYEQVLDPLHPNGINHKSYEALLKASFGTKEWETEATTWHLNVERTLLQDEEALERARKAFKSHVRAYATHTSSERHIFDMKALHLGHIAKSFALRETPGKGSQSSSGKKGSSVKKEKDPRKRMLQMARRHAAAGADEFNIGYG